MSRVTTVPSPLHREGACEVPLSGLLVIDFSRVLAGPFATMMLADLGARVVKVEKPGTGDDSRHYGPFVEEESLYFARVNRDRVVTAGDLPVPGQALNLSAYDDPAVRRTAPRLDEHGPSVRAELGGRHT